MRHIDLVVPISTPQSKHYSRADQAVAAADAIGDIPASVLARVIAKTHDVSVAELFHHSRSRAPIAATRQLAMYMMHVVLGRSLTQVGKFYGRDRTTVAHACMRMEDMRDEEAFDREVDQLEINFEAAMQNCSSLGANQMGKQAND